MKRVALWIFASLLMLPLAATAQVNSLPSQPHLLVKGQAYRTVDPTVSSLISRSATPICSLTWRANSSRSAPDRCWTACDATTC